VENLGTSLLQRRRRLLHTILLAIILATLPCYCAGAMLLGLAPDRDRVRVTITGVATLIDPGLLTQTGLPPVATLYPTITPLPWGQYTNTPIFGGPVLTPGQFVPPTSTWLPTLTWTFAPTATFPPTSTFFLPTSTTAPTITPTFTWTPVPSDMPTGTPVIVTLTSTPTPTATETATVESATDAPLLTPTPEVL
jgi:hypothetical protein